MTIDLTVTEEQFNVILACLREQKLGSTIDTYISILRQRQEGVNQAEPQLSIVEDEK